MGAIDDYIDGLEGKEGIDPIEVASKMLELHNEEISTRNAKIEELNAGIAQRDSALSSKNTEIERWKAKNFDLTLLIPSTNVDDNDSSHPRDEDWVDPGKISINDLFES